MQAPNEPFHLKGTLRIGGKGTDVTTPWYDVRFYPYTPPGGDPIFAAVGDKNVVVCRASMSDKSVCDVLQWFIDEDGLNAKNSLLNSIVWSKDRKTGDPLLCVAGEDPRIKILNPITGKLQRTLIGHGALVNDLQVSPQNPSIIVSASVDRSIRVWNLDEEYARQPTMVICEGEDISEGLLAVGMHHTGQFMLSGGMDSIVNMWVIPELPDKQSGTDKVHVIHYPHFSSTEVHTNMVDCIRFHNDLIFSRAATEDQILLWRLTKFSSASLPATSSPDFPPAIPPHTSTFTSPLSSKTATRSAFGGTFERLLTFEAPNTLSFFTRFSTFHMPGKRPLLAIGNADSRCLFWDLQTLEEGLPARTMAARDRARARRNNEQKQDAQTRHELREAKAEKAAKAKAAVSRNRGKRPVIDSSDESEGRARGGDTPSSASEESDLDSIDGFESDESDAEAGDGDGDPAALVLEIGDPFDAIDPHAHVEVRSVGFEYRAVSFSTGGEWCVACGGAGMIAVMRRWTS